MTITLNPATTDHAIDKLDARAQGCDRCGIDQLLRPLRQADVQIHTDFGEVYLCSTHQIAAGDALSGWPHTDLTDL